jgi:hypothetical protein
MFNADDDCVPSFLRRGPALILAAIICLCLAHGNTRADEASAELAREHLYAGTLAPGEAVLAAKVNADGGDREARFGLGLVRFALAVERFAQSLYRYGLAPPETLSVPLLRFPVPTNPTPEPITYQAFRDILKVFDDDLASAEKTLQNVGDGDVGIVVDIARVRFDLRRDGRASDDVY